ncbi:MAG: AI-2E family transporter [Candidatus Moranbacteria bacterium]|nr:AI-2E family transporter [Candidatus Moranbacteria bacterium]
MFRQNISRYFLIALIILIGIAVFKMFLPFMATLLMAFIFWQLFNPVFDYLGKITRHPKTSALITCFLVAIIIVLPFFIIGGIAAKEASELYKSMVKEPVPFFEIQKSLQNSLSSYFQSFGIDQSKVENSLNQIDFSEGLKKATSLAANFLTGAYQKISEFIFLAFVMLFALYYLFLDGNRFIRSLFQISPLSSKDEKIILNRFLSMNRATIKGTIIIGIVQGLLGGLSFWALGIGAPFLWGVIMGIFSVLPLIGPVIIWLPVAIWLIVSGFWIKGLVLLFFGSFIIGSVDNFLRPKLIGSDTALHPLWILIGTFGGILEFGIMGFVIGPLLVTIFFALLEIFEKKYLSNNQNAQP